MSVSELAKKTVSTLREEGVGRLLEKTKNYVGASLGGHGQKSKDKAFMDVLFINGCDKSVPHPPRYRVTGASLSFFCFFPLPLYRYDRRLYRKGQAAEQKGVF